ncbi:hypothetical protein CSPX01_01834 [Colletotrichum filicis]|nr:hypothetical protein CSPX01_01834 [Colletotrichum filicis]
MSVEEVPRCAAKYHYPRSNSEPQILGFRELGQRFWDFQEGINVRGVSMLPAGTHKIPSEGSNSFAVSPRWSSKANVKWLHTAIPHLPAHTKRHLAPMVSAHNDVLTGPNWAYPVATSGSRSPTPLQVASTARLGTDGEESIDIRLRGRRRRKQHFTLPTVGG